MTSAKVARINRHPGVMASPTLELDDDMRGRLIELIKADPYRALVRSAREVGVVGSKKQIRQLLEADDQFQDALFDARGTILDEVHSLRVANLFRKLGDLVENDASASQYRAITFALGLRQISVSEKVEHTGREGAPIMVEVDGSRVTGIGEVLELARSFGIGVASGVRDGLGTSADQPALPAAPDVLSDPAED